MRLIITAAHLLYAFSICFGQQVQKTIKRLPDTGQTKSYTSTFGEDNDYNIFVPYYLSNGNGTITDTVTGLMWQQTDGGEMTFENAFAYAENMILGGYDDWRLPSAFEAFTIQIHQNNNPALNTTFFTKNNAEYWWTSDRQKNEPNKIWVFNFSNLEKLISKAAVVLVITVERPQPSASKAWEASSKSIDQ